MPRICRIAKSRARKLCSSMRLCMAVAPLLLLSTLALMPALLLAQAVTLGEQRAVHTFDAAKSSKANALALEAFLAKMPKGGDLHMHLSGAVYAETMIDEAVADHLCFDTATLALVPGKGIGPTCAAGQFAVQAALTDPALYSKIVDALSMRDFVPTSGFSAHDQFFATFLRFASNSVHKGEWLDEVVTRAARQNEQYLEIMESPTAGAAFALVPSLQTDLSNPANFAAARAEISQSTIDEAVAQASKLVDGMEAQRNDLEHCGTPQAQPGCSVQVRWIDGVLRDMTPAQIFAQTLLGFALADRDPRVVGINYLRAEDWHGSLVEYHLGMQIVDYCHSLYPRVHISLHAGELAPGLVPPVDLTFHVREAVELGHAERIGHGVDVMYEANPHDLLREMAEKHVMVEINLTSNDVILGVVPPHHPLPEYRAAHVPVALSTDDEGVSRIDLTHEYVRAAMEYGLGYLDLKAMVRTSLEHSFLPGDSLWQKPDDFTHVKAACAGQTLGAASPTVKCKAMLDSSQRATQQWELERRLNAFESSLP
jgi:adenosine deaminase